MAAILAGSRHDHKSSGVTVMTRRIDKVFERFAAEDRAIDYLAQFPPEVAYGIALNVEWWFATRWATKQDELLRRNSQKNAIQISFYDFVQLITALIKFAPAIVNPAAEQHVIDILKRFPPDKAWWIAKKVTSWLACRSEIKVAPSGSVLTAS
jgi:hypothetical protein